MNAIAIHDAIHGIFVNLGDDWKSQKQCNENEVWKIV